MDERLIIVLLVITAVCGQPRQQAGPPVAMPPPRQPGFPPNRQSPPQRPFQQPTGVQPRPGTQQQRPGTQQQRPGTQQGQECPDLDPSATGYRRMINSGVQTCAQNFDRWLIFVTRQSAGGNQQQQQQQGIPPRQQTQQTNPILILSDIRHWDSICRYWDAAKRCVTSLQPSCSPAWAERQLQRREASSFPYNRNKPYPRNAFSRRFCQNGQLKPMLSQKLMDRTLNMQCLQNNDMERMSKCIDLASSELAGLSRRVVGDVSRVYQAEKQRYDGLARQALACSFSIIRRSRCNAISQEILQHVVRAHLPAVFDLRQLESTPLPRVTDTILDRTASTGIPSPQVTTTPQSSTCTLGLYAYTHLMSCGSAISDMVTCAYPGDTVLLSNKHLDITGKVVLAEGTNVNITVLSELHIFIKKDGGSRIIGQYDIYANQPMRETFTNNANIIGDVAIGKRGIGNLARVIMVKTEPRIVIILRQGFEGLFVTIGSDSSTILQSSGLLASGCPAANKITREELIRQLTNRQYSNNPGPNRGKRHAGTHRPTCYCNQTPGSVEYADCKASCIGKDPQSTADINMVKNIMTGQQQ